MQAQDVQRLFDFFGCTLPLRSQVRDDLTQEHLDSKKIPAKGNPREKMQPSHTHNTSEAVWKGRRLHTHTTHQKWTGEAGDFTHTQHIRGSLGRWEPENGNNINGFARKVRCTLWVLNMI